MKLFICLTALVALAATDDTADLKQLSDGNIQFTNKFFSEVVKKNPGKSVIMSAFSVLQPLAQLSLASEGPSHDELLSAIGLANDDVTRSVFPLIRTQLESIKGVTLKLASKVYVAQNFELNDEFAADNQRVFGSEVKNVDFTKSTAAASEINNWVEDQTEHRIKDLVSPDSLNDATRAVLVNAIYFKGIWKTQFNKNLTTDQDFYVTKDNKVKLPTMYIKSDFKYGESKELDAKLLELPYEGDEASFLIILPNEIDGLAALEEKLKDPQALVKAVGEMYSTEVEVSIPKFKIETTTNLKELLQKIGVNKIFGGEARLEKLLKTKEVLFVSEAIQKAFIEVDEQGAEAAAANVFAVDALSLAENTIFYVNHPFVYYLRNKDIELFEGVFYEPVN